MKRLIPFVSLPRNSTFYPIGRRFVSTTKDSSKHKNVSLYVHWPYCAKICPYCDFNKYLNHHKVNHEAMKSAFVKELDYFVQIAKKDSNNLKIGSVYFGKFVILSRSLSEL